MNATMLVVLVTSALLIVWLVSAITVAIVLGRSVKRGDESSELASLVRAVRRADSVTDPNRATEVPFTFGSTASPSVVSTRGPLRKTWSPQVGRESL